jgi:hypothetical protein
MRKFLVFAIAIVWSGFAPCAHGQGSTATIPPAVTGAPSQATKGTMAPTSAPSPATGGETSAPTFNPNDRVLFDATVSLTVLGVEIRCTEINARCWISGSFNSKLLVGEHNDEETEWRVDDTESAYIRLGGCQDSFCSVECDDVCSCVVRFLFATWDLTCPHLCR